MIFSAPQPAEAAPTIRPVCPVPRLSAPKRRSKQPVPNGNCTRLWHGRKHEEHQAISETNAVTHGRRTKDASQQPSLREPKMIGTLFRDIGERARVRFSFARACHPGFETLERALSTRYDGIQPHSKRCSIHCRIVGKVSVVRRRTPRLRVFAANLNFGHVLLRTLVPIHVIKQMR